MSPLQFQKQLHLREACRLILSNDLGPAGAAYRVGKGSNRLNYIPKSTGINFPKDWESDLMTREDPVCYTLCNQSRRPCCGFSPSLRKV